MRLQRIGGRKLMLSGSRSGVLVLRAVIVVACIGLYTVGFVAATKTVWLGVVLLAVAALITVPANALMRAQVQTLRRSELEGVRRRAGGGQ